MISLVKPRNVFSVSDMTRDLHIQVFTEEKSRPFKTFHLQVSKSTSVVFKESKTVIHRVHLTLLFTKVLIDTLCKYKTVMVKR